MQKSNFLVKARTNQIACSILWASPTGEVARDPQEDLEIVFLREFVWIESS